MTRQEILPILKWLGLALLLNCLLFVPMLVVYWDVGSIWPRSGFEPGDTLGKWLIVLTRTNPDFWRISGEFAVMFAIVYALRNQRWANWLLWVWVPLYLFLLYYQIYYAVSLRIYGQHPFFQNDWKLAMEVLPIFLGQVAKGQTWTFIGGIIGLIAASGLLAWIWRMLLHASQQLSYRKWQTILVCLLLFGVGILSLAPNRSDYRRDYHTLNWTSELVWESAHLPGADTYKHFNQRIKYDAFFRHDLAHRPNVYLLFVEAYGSIIQKLEGENEPFRQTMAMLSDTLAASGWGAVSAMSHAPVLGGRSWLSFTSVISGLPIQHHVQYTDLLAEQTDFPHLGRFLKDKGYQFHRLKTFRQSNPEIDPKTDPSLVYFDYDRFVDYPDIPYLGWHFDYFGGIPDQFALGYYEEGIDHPIDQPRFLFYISMATHVPFFPPPPLLPDWRALDAIKSDPYNIPVPEGTDLYMARFEEPMYFRYRRALEYDLKLYVQFIQTQIEPEDVVIVLGDHQPAMITQEGVHGMEVPVHVISQNQAFLKEFKAAGFIEGFTADGPIPSDIRHEGLYSLLVRGLIRGYGQDSTVLPTYYPAGI
ncbi:hypothetical protein [Pontibacter sp. G13]|uniref:hypothetical protein n=1 Tax=Pontibacter sp. G13 TaxID=3074898 RepID=UPI00288B7EBB|nr:hypothetical protein [Pontibacter sp. G13]WNJ16795.1 hypothetical protein RJD25_18155 [Pontibacter sp. G13]